MCRSEHPYGQTCYLCGREIRRGETFNRDHVPPLLLFPRSLRQEFGPQLKTLPVHRNCNSATTTDEEYFRASIGPSAAGNPIGDALCADLREAYRDPRRRRLGEQVMQEFGEIALPDGLAYKRYDGERVDRVLWKIARGLVRLETGTYVPSHTAHRSYIYPTPEECERSLANQPWFPGIRDTQPMGEYGRVFEYKAVGVLGTAEDHDWKTAQAWGFLFWDHVIAVVFFHNPGCACDGCRPPVDAGHSPV